MTRLPSTATKPVERFFEFSLLGLLASGYFAVVGSGFLDIPTVVVAGLGLVLRGLLVAGVLRFEFSARLVAVLTLVYIAFYPFDYLFISKEFLQATVHLVFFLAVIKVLTANTPRDYVYVKVIAFMELLAACILSANVNFFVFLTLFVLFAIATLTSSEIRTSTLKRKAVARGATRAFAWRLTGLTVSLFLGIIVLTGGLFFLLPRTARAAFQHLVPQRYHLLAGFSNEVVLGQIGEVKQQDTPVMHVRTNPSGPMPVGLKWRGIALSEFDGKRWYNVSTPGEFLRVEHGWLRLANVLQRGHRLLYEVQLKDIASSTLFFAGIPEAIQINTPLLVRSAADSYRVSLGTSDGLIYFVSSFVEDGRPNERPLVEPLLPSVRESYLRLPEIDPRVRELAARMTEGKVMPEEQAYAIESHLRRDYSYTLELPKKEVPDPLAHFLFTRKKGHCEYFASAMAVMLRTIGIPSRVVTGFQSGVFNPITGWQLVRASDAHSWVEAYLPREGWTTFDPTPPDPNGGSNSVWARISLYFDAADVFWQEWVLSYDLDRQLALAGKMEESSRNMRVNWLDGLGGWLRGYGRRAARSFEAHWLLAIPIVVFVWIVYRYGSHWQRWWAQRRRVRKVQRGEADASDATVLYQRMLNLLARRGVEKPAWLTPWEFARVLPPSEFSPVVEDLTVAYNDLRFGGRRDAAPKMVMLLEQLEKM